MLFSQIPAQAVVAMTLALQLASAAPTTTAQSVAKRSLFGLPAAVCNIRTSFTTKNSSGGVDKTYDFAEFVDDDGALQNGVGYLSNMQGTCSVTGNQVNRVSCSNGAAIWMVNNANTEASMDCADVGKFAGVITSSCATGSGDGYRINGQATDPTSGVVVIVGWTRDC